MRQAGYAAPTAVARFQRVALAVGVLAMAPCVVGGFFYPAQFFRSYLTGYLSYIGVALGCLALVMLHHLSGGGWGVVIRRMLESAAATLPVLALLFLPLALGMDQLYSWANPEVHGPSEGMQHRQAYLNAPFFLLRGVLYFAIWLLLSYWLNRWSRDQDRAAGSEAGRRLTALSGPGLVLYGLTVTFASIDWVMSLQPDWASTIYGLLFIGGQGLSATAFTIAVAIVLSRAEPISRVLGPRQLQDLGKLLLMFTMLWGYFAFSQLLVIWEANLPEEIPWYLQRWGGGWQWLGVALIVFHFALPFLLLLSRDLKRGAGGLAVVVALVILMRFVDMFWLTMPDFYSGRLRMHWMDLLAPIGLGGVWLAAFASQLKGRPLLPVHDPALKSLLADAARE